MKYRIIKKAFSDGRVWYYPQRKMCWWHYIEVAGMHMAFYRARFDSLDRCISYISNEKAKACVEVSREVLPRRF